VKEALNMSTQRDAPGVTSSDAELITTLASIPDRIAQMIANVDENIAHRRLSSEEWCVVEVVVHLGDVERRYRARLKRIVTEDAP